MPYHYYVLPEPPTGSQLTDDVQATLHLRNLGWTGRPNARGIAAASGRPAVACGTWGV